MRRCAHPFALTLFCCFTTRCLRAESLPLPATRPHVKRIVDGIMQPYIAPNHLPGAIVGVSLHGHRYYFPYGKATDSGTPFAPDTLVEIGSCTKTFTTTLFALAINRKQMDPNASSAEVHARRLHAAARGAGRHAAGARRLHLRHA